MKMRLFLALIVSTCGLCAGTPSWWPGSGTPPPPAQNYGPANVGQLKNMAKAAKGHMDSKLSGGAGTAINTLVTGFGPDNGISFTAAEYADHYRPINLGQLKAVAKPFYDRMIAAGYNPKVSLVGHGYPWGWAYNYPWNPSTPAADNYAPANIGQLKAVFAFDFDDFNVNAIPDTWEITHGFNINVLDANNNGIADGIDDSDGDGISNYQEYLDGTDPFNAGSAVSPPTQVADSTNQTQLVVWTLFN